MYMLEEKPTEKFNRIILVGNTEELKQVLMAEWPQDGEPDNYELEQSIRSAFSEDEERLCSNLVGESWSCTREYSITHDSNNEKIAIADKSVADGVYECDGVELEYELIARLFRYEQPQTNDEFTQAYGLSYEYELYPTNCEKWADLRELPELSQSDLESILVFLWKTLGNAHRGVVVPELIASLAGLSEYCKLDGVKPIPSDVSAYDWRVGFSYQSGSYTNEFSDSVSAHLRYLFRVEDGTSTIIIGSDHDA